MAASDDNEVALAAIEDGDGVEGVQEITGQARSAPDGVE